MSALGINVSSREPETWFDQRPTHNNKPWPPELVNAKEQADLIFQQLGRISDDRIDGKATAQELSDALCRSLQADLEYHQMLDKFNMGLL